MRVLGPMTKLCCCAGARVSVPVAGAELETGGAPRSASAQQQQQHEARAGFRQAQWQALHAAALQLLSASLGSPGSGQGCLDRRSVAEALAKAVPKEELQAAVHNACVLVDPSCGIKEYQAALAGKQGAPFHSKPVAVGALPPSFSSGKCSTILVPSNFAHGHVLHGRARDG